MIPDDDTPGAATAEAPEATSAEDLIPDEKPVATGEQEPPPKDEGESVAAETAGEGSEGAVDDAAVRDEFIKSIGAIKEADPDLYKDLFPEEQERQPSEDRETEIALRESRLERKETLQGAQTTFQQQYGASLTNAKPAFDGLQQEIVAQNERVKDGQASTVNPSYDKLATAVDQVRQESAAAAFGLASAMLDDSVQITLESHPTHRYLDTADRKRIADAKPEERMAVRIQAQLDAALARGAPLETKTRAKKDAEATVNMVEKLEKVKAFLGQNGTGKKVEAGGNTAESFEELEHLFAIGEATPIQEAAYMKLRGQRGLTT